MMSRANLRIALLAVVLFGVMHLTTGRIPTDGGQGYDGVDYGRMLTTGFAEGTPVTELRPLIILLNRPAYWLFGDVVRTFVTMNYLYAFALALGLLALLTLYEAPVGIRAYAVGTVFLTIAVARMLAYYPVLVDLGAYAVMTLAIVCIVTGRRGLAAVVCVAAALSREFGVVVAVFGMHRDIRLRVPIGRAVLTYLPAVVAWVGIRLVVEYVWEVPGELQQYEWLMDNSELWRDPFFAGIFFYFLLSIFGGLSAILVADAGRVWRFLRAEPEWITYALPITIAAALGGPETWRYLGCLVPAAVVLFAAVSREWSSGQRWLMLTGGLIVTVFTQQPFLSMTLDRYFIEWFPYYVALGDTPLEVPLALHPGWGWKLLGFVAAVWLLALAAQRHTMHPGARHDRLADTT